MDYEGSKKSIETEEYYPYVVKPWKVGLGEVEIDGICRGENPGNDHDKREQHEPLKYGELPFLDF